MENGPGSELPGNSFKEREKAETQEVPAPEGTASAEEKPVAIEGKVTRRRPSMGKRMATLFATEGQSFGEHLVEQVIIPTIKSTILTVIAQSGDALRMSFESMLFPGQTPKPGQPPRASYPGSGPTPYNTFANQNATPTVRREGGTYQPVRRSNVVDNLFIETSDRRVPDGILQELDYRITRQGHCSVGEYYEAGGMQSTSTDHTWGWRDIADARVNQVRDGFLIIMPPPISIQAR